MTIETSDGQPIEISPEFSHRLEASIMAVVTDRAESDGYNAVILRTSWGWREVSTSRALSRYLHQIRAPFSQDYMWETLRKNAAITANLVALFQDRLDPRLAVTDSERSARETSLLAEIEEQLQSVASLDEDRILRRFTNLVQSTIRTNLWQVGKDGHPRPVISFKFNARGIEDLPAPRPLYEIFVYSPRVEGIHLRFGKVARGGLRWSDRPQDFRTEILGLVKAQQVKNAVIVPVGAKGGFVPKRLPPPSNREAWLAEGTEAYRIFIRSLLELTDNLDGDDLVPPDSTVRHAALAGDEACGGIRSPRHLHRSFARSGEQLRRTQAPVRPVAIELAGLQQSADLNGRRRVLALAQGDSARTGSAHPARSRQAA